MAKDKTPMPAQSGPTPRHYMPPTARELRAQAVHRLQVGLFGLVAMLLLVALANIINDRVRLAETPEGAAATASEGASDPLADIGVVPAADPAVQPPATDPALVPAN